MKEYMAIDKLIEEKNGEVKILDLIKYPELHDLEVKPVEKVTDDEMFEECNESHKVYEWINTMFYVANRTQILESADEVWKELMDVNFEEV